MNQNHAPLQHPLAEVVVNQRTRMVEGIDSVRVPVPWALDHVNCWLFDEPDVKGSAGTLIDTGINNKTTQTMWQTVFKDTLPHRLLITHYHPDHSGLAGWFHERGSECYSHPEEIELIHHTWDISTEAYVRGFSDWYTEHGLDDTHTRAVHHVGHGYRATVAELPSITSWQTLSAGDEITLGHRVFEVLTGHGHSTSMLMFFCRAENLLIAADQVLPRISPNISVFPGTSDQNPLESFLNSLDALLSLPENTLVLPSHGDPFIGLHQRIRGLQEHHHERLDRLRECCTRPVQAVDVLSTLFSRKLDVQQMSFALGEAIAHLRYLVSLGELIEQQESGKTVFLPA